jgi:hypothetical protein
VDIYDGSAGFDQSSGPKLYATYTIVVIIISIAATLVFTQFLPKDKDQAQEWKNTPVSPWTLYRGKSYCNFFIFLDYRKIYIQ